MRWLKAPSKSPLSFNGQVDHHESTGADDGWRFASGQRFWQESRWHNGQSTVVAASAVAESDGGMDEVRELRKQAKRRETPARIGILVILMVPE